MVSSAGQVFTSLIGANTGNTPQSSPTDWAALGLSCSQALCPSTYGNANLGTAETSAATSIALQSGYGGITTGYGCFWVDTEYECYQYMSGGVLYGLTRGAYGTTAAAHANGAQIYPTNVVGNVGNTPGLIVSYGWAANPLVAVNNPFPNYHANNSVFSVNSGGNELFISPTGQIYQQNPSAVSYFYGNIQVSSAPNVPVIASSGNLLQNNGPNTAYQPIGFGGGVAGSLNVITTPTLGPPVIGDYSAGGTSTRTYVCSGVDFDGNLIPGTPASDTHAASTVPAPNFISIVCPYAAGIAGYQVWRTAGGPSQGLLTGVNADEGLQVFDSDNATTGGSPPSSNGSSPHISVAGTTHSVCDTSVSPNVCMIVGAGVPTGCGTTYGVGSTYGNETGSTNPVYMCTNTGWVQVGQTEYDITSGWAATGQNGTVVIGVDTPTHAGHFSNLSINYAGGGCTTAPYFNVFDTASHVGTPIQAVGGSSQQAYGTATNQPQTLTFAAGDNIGIIISTQGATCPGSFTVTAHVVEP